MGSQGSYIITQGGISVFVDGRLYDIDTSHRYYNEIFEGIKQDDWKSVLTFVNLANTLEKYVEESTDASQQNLRLDLRTEQIFYKDSLVDETITARIFQMRDEGFNIDPMLRFLDNLYQNPSKTAIDELYDFLEYGKNPITPDGHFLAYKRVNNDYTSIHDSKTDNSIGTIVEMPRYAVDDNRHRTCSHGLHFCSYEYLRSFGGSRLVILKVNPKDVVSIPSDYNNTKGRACRYEIVGELGDEYIKDYDNIDETQGIWSKTVVFDPSGLDEDWTDWPHDQDDFDDEVENCFGDESEERDESYEDGWDDFPFGGVVGSPWGAKFEPFVPKWTEEMFDDKDKEDSVVSQPQTDGSSLLPVTVTKTVIDIKDQLNKILNQPSNFSIQATEQQVGDIMCERYYRAGYNDGISKNPMNSNYLIAIEDALPYWYKKGYVDARSNRSNMFDVS